MRSQAESIQSEARKAKSEMVQAYKVASEKTQL
jgi:hypothetical protein